MKKRNWMNKLSGKTMNIMAAMALILDSRINMTRLVPQLRVLHKSQPA